jgi:NAD(P)-dependent dehydrogenase (short-subunit alcohol dehydrogenase family)
MNIAAIEYPTQRIEAVHVVRLGETDAAQMTEPVCVISGVGPGTGSALARRFAAGGNCVAMLARNAQRLAGLERELPGSKGYSCDVSDPAQVEATAERIERELGGPTTLVHNAVGGAFGSFLEIDPAVLNRNFQVNTMGLLYLARRLAPAMIRAGSGNIIVTGNTSALRGKPSFAGFAPTKAAQRILTEAIARELGPKGVHVAYMVIDAVVDVPWTRERFKAKPDEFFIKPAAIAEEAWHLTQQDRSAWSFNVELRPYGENW